MTVKELIKYWSSHSLVFRNVLVLHLLCLSQSLRSWRLTTLPYVLLKFPVEQVKCMKSYFSYNSQLKDYRWVKLQVLTFLWCCCRSTVVFGNLSNIAEDERRSFFFYLNSTVQTWNDLHTGAALQVVKALWSMQTCRLTLTTLSVLGTSQAFFSLSKAYKREP